MAILDTINVIATDLYKEWVLENVFRYTGSAIESTTEMELTVSLSTQGLPLKQNVRFRRGEGSVFIHGYDIAIPAETRVTGFELREIGEASLTASVSLTSEEQKQFDDAGILYIDELRFRLNVSLG